MRVFTGYSGSVNRYFEEKLNKAFPEVAANLFFEGFNGCYETRGLNVFFPGEPSTVKSNYGKRFIKQFDLVFGHQSMPYSNCIFNPVVLPEMIDLSFNSDTSQWDVMPCCSKSDEKKITNKVVAVLSKKNITATHKERGEFVEGLRSKGAIDVYGVGYKSIDSKCKLYQRYRYVLVFENANEYGYLSEKLVDCLLSKSIPICVGFDVPDSVDQNGIISLDSLDVGSFISSLDRFNKWFEANEAIVRDAIDSNYELALERFSLVGRIQGVIPYISSSSSGFEKKIIKPESMFKTERVIRKIKAWGL